MMNYRLAVVFVLGTMACTASVQPINQPPERLPEPSNPASPPATESVTRESCVETMTVWLAMFRSEQERHFAAKGRFAEDETVGGRLRRLGKPFETYYWLTASARSYYVRVRNSECRRQCELEQRRFGNDPPGDDPIVCGPF